MTREEQIIEAGVYHSCGSRPPKTHGHNMHEMAYISRNLVFEAGANWADENPKPGTINKQEFIEKAKEWLERTLYIHTEIETDRDFCELMHTDWVTSDYDSVEDFINGFCKAMEE